MTSLDNATFPPGSRRSNFESRNSVPLKLLVQPGAGIGPVAVNRAGGNSQYIRDLGNGEAGEVPEFYDLRRCAIDLRECLERIVERHEVAYRRGHRQDRVLAMYPVLVPASFDSMLAPIVLDQNPSHRFRGRCKEVPSAVPSPRAVTVDQAQIRLVHKCSRLKRLPRC